MASAGSPQETDALKRTPAEFLSWTVARPGHSHGHDVALLLLSSRRRPSSCWTDPANVRSTGAFSRLGVEWRGSFFVLSGFLIGQILLKARKSRAYFGTFYLRRFFRIIPVYYARILTYLLATELLWFWQSIPLGES